jgi:hypothetical protein
VPGGPALQGRADGQSSWQSRVLGLAGPDCIFTCLLLLTDMLLVQVYGAHDNLSSKVVQVQEAFLRELPPSGAYRIALAGAQTRN